MPEKLVYDDIEKSLQRMANAAALTFAADPVHAKQLGPAVVNRLFAEFKELNSEIDK